MFSCHLDKRRKRECLMFSCHLLKSEGRGIHWLCGNVVGSVSLMSLGFLFFFCASSCTRACSSAFHLLDGRAGSSGCGSSVGF